MPTVVQKFGGSSLADLSRLAEVADLVTATHRTGCRLVVVVSAMGKTTEGLLDLARQAGIVGTPSQNPPREPPRREFDMLVSTGERVSMALLAIALSARGTSAVSLTGSQAGILTSSRHFDAEVLEIQPQRIEQQLAQGRVVIVAGYQGVSRSREITTLGRGGSDTTAVALAAVLRAERCEIYSDVDGVYTADPHRVRAAQHLPVLDYPTLQAMADAGAKVVNARAVAWGARYGVAIHARATADYALGRGGRETRVVAEPGAAPARAIVACSRLALVAAQSGAAGALLAALREAELPTRDVRVFPGRALVTVPLSSVPDFGGVQLWLENQQIPGLVIEEHCAEICALGSGVERHAETLLASLGADSRLALSEQGRVSAVIAPEAVLEAERSWHRLLVEAA
jgi:aspartate kinase